MKIKTSELTGKALDYAVALAQGWKKMADYNGYSTPNGVVIAPEYIPSWDWSQCGELIEKHHVELIFNSVSEEWSAYIFSFEELESVLEDGESPTIAICRAVVAAQLGDEVDIPDELVEGV
ncbi:phage protein NinX family protein [Xenorhabdus bovienii]|uniref:phage protein NinX family protein n=1 Tax=Xenorhabdus bovienii TaxID=40576 RepID=UPI003DA61497